MAGNPLVTVMTTVDAQAVSSSSKCAPSRLTCLPFGWLVKGSKIRSTRQVASRLPYVL